MGVKADGSVQVVNRELRLIQANIQNPAVDERRRKLGIDPDRLIVILDGSLGLAEQVVGVASVQVGRRGLGVCFDGFVVLGDGIFRLALFLDSNPARKYCSASSEPPQAVDNIITRAAATAQSTRLINLRSVE